MQEAALLTPWCLAFRGKTIPDRELARNSNGLGIVKSAESICISIPPNSTFSISGYIDKVIPYHINLQLQFYKLHSALLFH